MAREVGIDRLSSQAGLGPKGPFLCHSRQRRACGVQVVIYIGLWLLSGARCRAREWGNRVGVLFPRRAGARRVPIGCLAIARGARQCFGPLAHGILCFGISPRQVVSTPGAGVNAPIRERAARNDFGSDFWQARLQGVNSQMAAFLAQSFCVGPRCRHGVNKVARRVAPIEMISSADGGLGEGTEHDSRLQPVFLATNCPANIAKQRRSVTLGVGTACEPSGLGTRLPWFRKQSHGAMIQLVLRRSGRLAMGHRPSADRPAHWRGVFVPACACMHACVGLWLCSMLAHCVFS